MSSLRAFNDGGLHDMYGVMHAGDQRHAGGGNSLFHVLCSPVFIGGDMHALVGRVRGLHSKAALREAGIPASMSDLLGIKCLSRATDSFGRPVCGAFVNAKLCYAPNGVASRADSSGQALH